MTWKTAFISAAALMVLAAGPALQTARAEGCEAGAKVDSSTADDAKKTIENAGFQQVRDLTKSCDNFWHGMAVKDGKESHVVLTPQGQVMREGD